MVTAAITIPAELAADITARPGAYRPDVEEGAEVLGFRWLEDPTRDYAIGAASLRPGQPWLDVHVPTLGHLTAAVWALVGSIDGGPRPEVGQRVLVRDRCGCGEVGVVEGWQDDGRLTVRLAGTSPGLEIVVPADWWALLPPPPAAKRPSRADRDMTAYADLCDAVHAGAKTVDQARTELGVPPEVAAERAAARDREGTARQGVEARLAELQAQAQADRGESTQTTDPGPEVHQRPAPEPPPGEASSADNPHEAPAVEEVDDEVLNDYIPGLLRQLHTRRLAAGAAKAEIRHALGRPVEHDDCRCQDGHPCSAWDGVEAPTGEPDDASVTRRITIPADVAGDVAARPEAYRPGPHLDREVLTLAAAEGGPRLTGRIVTAKNRDARRGAALVVQCDDGELAYATAWALVGSADAGPRPAVRDRVLVLAATPGGGETVGHVGVVRHVPALPACGRWHEDDDGTILVSFDPGIPSSIGGRTEATRLARWALLPPLPEQRAADGVGIELPPRGPIINDGVLPLLARNASARAEIERLRAEAERQRRAARTHAEAVAAVARRVIDVDPAATPGPLLVGEVVDQLVAEIEQLQREVADRDRYRGHSITLNAATWRLAVALGDVDPDAEHETIADPAEVAERAAAQLIADHGAHALLADAEAEVKRLRAALERIAQGRIYATGDDGAARAANLHQTTARLALDGGQ